MITKDSSISADTPSVKQTSTRRIVRIPMPAGLIREMDTALAANAGGYTTREEFIGDAVRDRLLELEYDHAPPGPGEQPVTPLTALAEGVTAAPSNAAPPYDLDQTVLRAPQPGFVLDGEAAVPDSALLGLHNRDYTSLWALSQLAGLLAESSLPFAATLREVTKRAWEFSARVRPLDADADLKLTSLFPTNRAKVQAASGQFRAFAIGTVRESEGRLHGDGPLFVWKALQARRGADNIEIGMTRPGWDLLAAVDGISLRLPHSPEVASRYFDYLHEHAPADLAGLMVVLRGAGERMTRAELIAAYQTHYSSWTEAQSSTNAAGYIARGREWGLVEPKLIERRYRLTHEGERLASELREGQI